jgi:hypothetical protein
MFHEVDHIASLLEKAFDLDSHSFPPDTSSDVFRDARAIVAAANDPGFVRNLKNLSDSATLTRPWLLDALKQAQTREFSEVRPDSPMDTSEVGPSPLFDVAEGSELRSPPAKRSRQSLATSASEAGPSRLPSYPFPAALPFGAESSISRTASLTGTSHTSEGGSAVSGASRVKPKPKRKRTTEGQ